MTYHYGMLENPTTKQLGSAEYWKASIAWYASKWSDIRKAQLDTLIQLGATIAYWRSDANGLPCNGGLKKGALIPVGNEVFTTTAEGQPRPGKMIELCTNQVLHATLKVPRWNGSRLWIVGLFGSEIIGDEEKFGAARRQIIGEALPFSEEELKKALENA